MAMLLPLKVYPVLFNYFFQQGSYLPNQRILMTKNPNASSIVGASSPWPDTARLVDGNTTQDGRLDLLYKGKWRGVCTNYNK